MLGFFDNVIKKIKNTYYADTYKKGYNDLINVFRRVTPLEHDQIDKIYELCLPLVSNKQLLAEKISLLKRAIQNKVLLAEENTKSEVSDDDSAFSRKDSYRRFTLKSDNNENSRSVEFESVNFVKFNSKTGKKLVNIGRDVSVCIGGKIYYGDVGADDEEEYFTEENVSYLNTLIHKSKECGLACKIVNCKGCIERKLRKEIKKELEIESKMAELEAKRKKSTFYCSKVITDLNVKLGIPKIFGLSVADDNFDPDKHLDSEEREAFYLWKADQKEKIQQAKKKLNFKNMFKITSQNSSGNSSFNHPVSESSFSSTKLDRSGVSIEQFKETVTSQRFNEANTSSFTKLTNPFDECSDPIAPEINPFGKVEDNNNLFKTSQNSESSSSSNTNENLSASQNNTFKVTSNQESDANSSSLNKLSQLKDKGVGSYEQGNPLKIKETESNIGFPLGIQNNTNRNDLNTSSIYDNSSAINKSEGEKTQLKVTFNDRTEVKVISKDNQAEEVVNKTSDSSLLPQDLKNDTNQTLSQPNNSFTSSNTMFSNAFTPKVLKNPFECDDSDESSENVFKKVGIKSTSNADIASNNATFSSSQLKVNFDEMAKKPVDPAFPPKFVPMSGKFSSDNIFQRDSQNAGQSSSSFDVTKTAPSSNPNLNTDSLSGTDQAKKSIFSAFSPSTTSVDFSKNAQIPTPAFNSFVNTNTNSPGPFSSVSQASGTSSSAPIFNRAKFSPSPLQTQSSSNSTSTFNNPLSSVQGSTLPSFVSGFDPSQFKIKSIDELKKGFEGRNVFMKPENLDQEMLTKNKDDFTEDGLFKRRARRKQ